MEPDKLSNIRALVVEAMAPTTTPDRLTAIYLELSGRCFGLADKVGKAHRACLDAERTRKAAHAAHKMRSLNAGVPIGKAETLAEHDTARERQAEVDAHALHVELREAHRAAQDVMSAIQMRIGWLRTELQQSARQA